MKDSQSQLDIDKSTANPNSSSPLEIVEHPIGVAIGAVLGGGATAATAGLLAGSMGAVIGMVVGAVAGGIGGKAVADVISPSGEEMTMYDTHSLPPPHHSELTANIEHGDRDSRPATTEQALREQWHHLDESNKDLIKGSQLTEADEE